ILDPGALGLVGDKVELVPQPVELILAVSVQDQLHQGGVVAVITAGIVIAGVQQAAIVGRLIGPVAAALADIKGVGEDGGETVERLLVFRLLAGRIDQVGIAVARMRRQDRPAWRGIFVQRRIFRNRRRHRLLFVVGTQIIGIALAVIVRIFLQAPIVQRFGLA